jgi:hypothetical protein
MSSPPQILDPRQQYFKPGSPSPHPSLLIPTIGSSLHCPLAPDPWTGELVMSICCSKCNKFIDFGITGEKASCCAMMKYTWKVWRKQLKLQPIGLCENDHKVPEGNLDESNDSIKINISEKQQISHHP